MTEREIADLGPAFAAYLRRSRRCFRRHRTAEHFGAYGRGLLTDLPRKSVEPVAPAAGTPVRTLREFPTAARWSRADARDALRRHPSEGIAAAPADPLGAAGVIDETSCRKWGGRTPGVRRQYLGCAGELDPGTATVHVAVARGTFRTLADADLYPPAAWDADRDRCRAAGVPDGVAYRPEWRIARDRPARRERRGVRPDRPAFDEGYGAAVPMLRILDPAGRRSAAEVPADFAVRDAAAGPSAGRCGTGGGGRRPRPPGSGAGRTPRSRPSARGPGT